MQEIYPVSSPLIIKVCLPSKLLIVFSCENCDFLKFTYVVKIVNFLKFYNYVVKFVKKMVFDFVKKCENLTTPVTPLILASQWHTSLLMMVHHLIFPCSIN